jgi:serine/threonine protein kinase
MSPPSWWSELKRRGVLGALVGYTVVAGGALQLGDVISHAIDLPTAFMRWLVALAALGLPTTFFVSWFYDLTPKGLVLTAPPTERSPQPPITAGSPQPGPATPEAAQPVTPQARTPSQALVPAQPLPLELGPGAQLAGRYRIERELGQGGMGRVLLASDEKLGRRVAIKVLLGAHDPQRLRRFEQEARSAGALEHPNVLAVYDLGEQGGAPFLVTELLEGRTLREALDEGPLGPHTVREVGLQLARGLGAAHQRGVIHRDLKPENLFLTRDGRLKILDFGLAKLVGEGEAAGLTQTGAVFGTPGYLSPEQARGLPADARSDVFAAGAVLHELLAGRRAFPGATMIEAGAATLTQEPTPLPRGVPAGLAQVVARALEKDPARRPPNGNALAQELEQLGTTSAAHLEVARASLPKSLPRGAVLLAAVLIGGALAVSGLVVGKVTRSKRSGRVVRVEPVFPSPPVPPAAPGSPTPPVPPGGDAEPDAPEAPLPPGKHALDPTASWPKIVLQTSKGPRSIPVPPGLEPKAFGEMMAEAMRAEAEGRRATAEGRRSAKEAAREARRAGGGGGGGGVGPSAQAGGNSPAAPEGLPDPADLNRIQVLEITQTLGRSGQLAEAAAFIDRAIADEPDDLYYRLHRAVVQRRQGRLAQASAELLGFVREQELDAEGAAWPAPVLRFYAGQLDDAALEGFARAQRGEATSRFCEIHYYLGLYYKTQRPPDPGKAMSYLGQAASAKGVRDIERSLAELEQRAR